MKKTVLIVAFIISALLLLFGGCAPACDKESGKTEKPMGEAGTWSIFLYLCGSNLETKNGSAGKNLDELLSVDIPDNVHIIV